jgi:hypothetical protein
MSKLITHSFKAYVAERIASSNSSLFIALGNHIPFTNESSPPTLEQTTNDTFTYIHDNAIVAKSLNLYNAASPNTTTADVQYMIPRIDWSSNTGYTAYRHTSANVGYVGVFGASGYEVFKCLSNNDGLNQIRSQYAPSLASTSASDDIYNTADGYQWKYMYSIPTAVFSKFATESYIPVYHDADVRTYANDGGIEYIDVSYAGSHYNATTGGTFQAVNIGGNNYIHQIETNPSGYADASSYGSFYNGSAIKIISGLGAGEMRTIVSYTVAGAVRSVVLDSPFSSVSTSSQYEISPKVVVTGDGSGFVGRALVNTASTNTVYAIEIIQPGSGYRHATATLQGNTSGTTNTATVNVILSPPGGHGYNPIEELGGRYLCLTTSFNVADATANTKLINVNDFRTISVIKSPLLANVSMTLTNVLGTYSVGETVTQSGTLATGTVVSRTATTIKLTNVAGSFLPEPATPGSQYTLTGATSLATADVVDVYNNGSNALTANVDYVNLTTRVSIGSVTGTFQQDEPVVLYTGSTASSTGKIYHANTSQLWLTNVVGPVTDNSTMTISGTLSGASATITTMLPRDLVNYTGKVLYEENISPINRSTGQTETVKVIIEF